MSFTLTWSRNQRIVDLHCTGDMTFEEIERIVSRYTEMILMGDPPVHTIADIRDVSTFPRDVLRLRAALTSVRITNGQLGWIVIVAEASPLKRFFASLIAQIVIPGVKLQFQDTAEDALAFLASVDDTLM